MSCNWATFAPGATVAITVVLRPKATGSFSPTATVTQDPGDSNSANDFDTDPTTVATNGRGCTLVGSMGPDTLNGTPGADVICALGGDDRVNGMGGSDSLYGQAGNDTLTDTSGTDKLLGGPGNDSMNTQDGSGGDTVNGGRGTNTCTTDALDNRKNCS